MISYIFFIILLALAAFLAIKISIADLRRRIIPDAYLFPLMLIGLILISFYTFPISLHNAVVGATFGYLMALITGIIFEKALASVYRYIFRIFIGRKRMFPNLSSFSDNCCTFAPIKHSHYG